MSPTQYAIFYNISPVLIPILEKLKPKDYHFLNRKVADNGEVIVNTGWYSGTGAFTERRSAAPDIIRAAKKAGFTAVKFYAAAKPSAKNERVKIVIVPTALKQDFNNK